MHAGHGTRAGLVALLIVLAAGVALLQGCRTGEQAPGPLAGAAAETTPEPKNEHMIPPPGHGPYTGTVADWPLWFPWHKFGAYCFETRRCEIRYAGFRHGGPEKVQPSLASFGRPIEKIVSAGWGPYRNFPPPAEVAWVAMDGTSLTATVDIAEIFADRMVRHTVPREEILENSYIPYPGIIVVIDGRTINVYMSAWLPLKESRSQAPDNKGGKVHTEVVLVSSRTY